MDCVDTARTFGGTLKSMGAAGELGWLMNTELSSAVSQVLGGDDCGGLTGNEEGKACQRDKPVGPRIILDKLDQCQ